MTRYSATDFKRIAVELIDEIKDTSEVVYIQRKKQDVAVLISVEQFQKLTQSK